ncbi:MAG TPA: hypothetical protein VFC19_29290 [Candidatus Limnocylindrales bacterium]|nr:hypothetical protein [Candidatus Limnocylindrales bacterium]
MDKCCALDTGAGHDGACAWTCSNCSGSGVCPVCGGTGQDASGPDSTCMDCIGGACPYCIEGMYSYA